VGKQNAASTYHVLLIGIDRYPPGYNSLAGCVNDIDAIEQLLLTQPGVGIPPGQINIIRLAAPQFGASHAWQSKAETMPPTRANVLNSLKTLAGPTVKPSDRVLIYYSGHGDQKLWVGSPVWHEALVPNNDLVIEYLYDVEVNLLLNAIAKRTSDLTIILDCCHSAGATRDFQGIKPQGAARFLKGDNNPAVPPNLKEVGLIIGTIQEQSQGVGLSQSSATDYLVICACQSDETAGEGAYPQNRPTHGVFTCGFLKVLRNKDPAQISSLRWADIWPKLLAEVANTNMHLSQRTQHPWIIGREERRVFGGPWEKMDAGFQITKRSDGQYAVGVGSLMGVTEGAEIAVYGSEPRLFSPIGSPEDQPIGRLKVSQTEQSSSVAFEISTEFALPNGERGRLVKPGESQRLRVSLKQIDAELKTKLEESPMIEVVSAEDPNPDVEVVVQSGGGWIIGNDTEPLLATVPAGEHQAMRIGLEHYYRYVTVLRMARNCFNPHLGNCLNVRLLDCNDTDTLNAMSPQKKADPDLPEAPRDQARVYALQPGFKFCIKVVNSSLYPLNVFLLNCSSGGLVEYLSDAIIREGAAHVMWLDNNLGTPFETRPDKMPTFGPGITMPSYVTDRMIAIGTSRRDVDLDYLYIDKIVQQVIQENLSTRLLKAKSLRPTPEHIAPAELWASAITPIRINRVS
jgi:hypothetical protein